MNDLIYFLSDDSCFPLDPCDLKVHSLPKAEYLELYGHLDWTFNSHHAAVAFIIEGIKDE